jgi:hypothetical protein
MRLRHKAHAGSSWIAAATSQGEQQDATASTKREQKIDEEMHGSMRRDRQQIEWRGLCVIRIPYETTNSSDPLDPNSSMDGRNMRRFSRCTHAFRRRPEG